MDIQVVLLPFVTKNKAAVKFCNRSVHMLLLSIGLISINEIAESKSMYI